MADDKRTMLFRLAAPLVQSILLDSWCALRVARFELPFAGRTGCRLTPIEVKWTESPTLNDARHMLALLNEKPKQAQQACVICRWLRNDSPLPASRLGGRGQSGWVNRMSFFGVCGCTRFHRSMKRKNTPGPNESSITATPKTTPVPECQSPARSGIQCR